MELERASVACFMQTANQITGNAKENQPPKKINDVKTIKKANKKRSVSKEALKVEVIEEPMQEVVN